jgi:hypothetical protein
VTTPPDDIEVIHMTAVEWDQALTNSLNDLDLTWEQLTEQAKTGDFPSLKARQLWLMAAGQGPNQAAADPGSLPRRMAEAIVSHEWDDFPRSAHGDHNYYGACAICQGDIPRIAEVALAALLKNPGDVPKRMAEAIDETWTLEEDFDAEKAARAALSVRDEPVAHLSARAAVAEARVEHAEAGAQLSSERLAKVQQELAEAQAQIERERKDVPGDLVESALTKPEVALVVWPHELRAILAVVLPMHEKQLQAERDALKSAAQAALDKPHAARTVRMLCAALAISEKNETTTTPARETA